MVVACAGHRPAGRNESPRPRGTWAGVHGRAPPTWGPVMSAGPSGSGSAEARGSAAGVFRRPALRERREALVAIPAVQGHLVARALDAQAVGEVGVEAALD